MSTISASTTTTTAFKVTSDTTGTLVLQTGSTPTTAMTLDASGNLGIGTSSPTGIIEMATNASSDAFLTSYNSVGAATSAAYTVRRARGTAASPSAVLSTDVLGGLYSRGYKATAFSGNVGVIRFEAAENWTDTANGTYITFAATPIGSTTRTEYMRLDASGNLGIGTSSPSTKLDVRGTVNGSDGTNGNVRMYVDSSYGFFQSLNQAANAYRPMQLMGSTISLANNGTINAILDASGTLGVGITPNTWGGGGKAIQLPGGAISGYSSAGNNQLILWNNCYYGSNFTYTTTDYANYFRIYNGDYAWFTAPSGTAGTTPTFTQVMTLDKNGNLLVGTTSQLGSVTARGVFVGGSNLLALQAGNGNVGAYMTNTSGTGNWQPFSFCNTGTSFSQIGSITCTAAATAYNTSSDYRLKSDVQPMAGALARVAALKPVTYKWNIDGSAGEGFIAHELAEVCPYAVAGEKDAVDAEGKPVYQGVDTSFLVATLAAAIQELKAEFDAYKASHP